MSNADYNKQISFRDDGVYVDGVKVPGTVDCEFEIGRSTEVPDHWTVRLTLITGTEPKFELEECEAERLGMETTTYRHRPVRRDREVTE